MRIGAERFNRLGGIELEGPKRQVVPVAAEVGHRAVAKIPPAIPLRPRKIDFMEWAGRRGAEPQIPIEIAGRLLPFSGSLGDINDVLVFRRVLLALPAPRSRDPNVSLSHRADCPRLNQ